jgi:hypothetical protein
MHEQRSAGVGPLDDFSVPRPVGQRPVQLFVNVVAGGLAAQGSVGPESLRSV